MASNESLINIIQKKSTMIMVEVLVDKYLIQNLLSGKEKFPNINALLCGDINVGKSSIAMRYTQSKFDSFYIESIEIEQHNKAFKILDKNYNYNLFVTVGNQRKENYENLYKKCDILFFIFDLSSKKSYESIKKTKNDIKKYLQKQQIYVFVGNKCDLIKREVSSLHVNKYCEENLIEYFEVSAKNNINIDRMFYKIGDLYNKNYK